MRKIIYWIALCNISSTFTLGQCTKLRPIGITPLFSLGHSILGKDVFALSQQVFFLKQTPHSGLLAVSNGYYGINDKITAILSIPVYSEKSPISHKKAGLGDLYLHSNNLMYRNKTNDYSYRIISTTGIRFPTTTTIPGQLFYTLDTTSFALGLVYDAMTPNWFIYSDVDAIITTKRNKNKYGNVIIFNGGIGHAFCFNEHHITLLVELSDFYLRPDRINKEINFQSGGNFFLVGPTVRYAYKKCIIQGGIQFDAGHSFRENNYKLHYIAGFFVGYIF